MSKPRLWAWIGGGVLVLLVAGAIAAYLLARPYAQIGGSYIAKQLCSCVFVTGRTDASCHTEFEPDIDKFQVKISHHRHTVRARLLIFSSAASYTEGYGCTVVK